MGSFKLAKMTLGSLFKKPATVKYPYEEVELYPAMRGHVVNNVEACIMCGMCARVCPADAITVDRKAGNWTINPYSCIQCASCVRECPKNCLSMDVHCTEPTTKIESSTMHKDMPAKPAPKAKAAGAKAAAKPKRELTPEQQARVEEARKKAAAKKAAKAAEADAQ